MKRDLKKRVLASVTVYCYGQQRVRLMSDGDNMINATDHLPSLLTSCAT